MNGKCNCTMCENRKLKNEEIEAKIKQMIDGLSTELHSQDFIERKEEIVSLIDELKWEC